MSKAEIIAQDVIRIPTGIANAYIIGSYENWILVDTGTPGNKTNILSAVNEHIGRKAAPRAIVLTHGHFDHSGTANELAEHWGVSIHVHRRELPFVDGRSAYPPPDPTVGGFMSQVIRFIPNSKITLRSQLRELESGPLPWLRQWQVIETPGHTAGHVSLFREQDGVLVAGDAFTTMNQDSMIGTLSQKQQAWRPPTYYTPDWHQARKSVRKLAAMGPRVLAAGHGVPMSGWGALEQLRQLAEDFPIPKHGRYVEEPVRYYEGGIAYLPPAAPDSVKRAAVITAAAAAMAGAGLWLANRRSSIESHRFEDKPAA